MLSERAPESRLMYMCVNSRSIRCICTVEMYRLNYNDGWTYCLHFEVSMMTICQRDAAFIVIDMMIHKWLLDSATCILMPVCWVCPATVEMAALIVMQWSSAAFVYGFALLINMQTGGMWLRGWIVPLLLRDTGCFLQPWLSFSDLIAASVQHPLHWALGVSTPTSIWYQTSDYHWCHQVTSTSLGYQFWFFPCRMVIVSNIRNV